MSEEYIDSAFRRSTETETRLFQTLLLLYECCYTPLLPTVPLHCLKLTECSHDKSLVARGREGIPLVLRHDGEVISENTILCGLWDCVGYQHIQGMCVKIQYVCVGMCDRTSVFLRQSFLCSVPAPSA